MGGGQISIKSFAAAVDISKYLLYSYLPPARVAAHQRRHFRRSILSSPDWRSGFCHVVGVNFLFLKALP